MAGDRLVAGEYLLVDYVSTDNARRVAGEYLIVDYVSTDQARRMAGVYLMVDYIAAGDPYGPRIQMDV